MNEVLKVLIEYWKPIVCFIFLFASFILHLCKKKPVKVVDTIRETIATLLPYYIRLSEDKYGAGNGEFKKAYATELIVEFIKKQFSLSDDVANGYVPFISMLIKSTFDQLKSVM